MLRLVSYAYMPSPLPRQVGWSLFARLLSIAQRPSLWTVRSAPATAFSGPARRSLTLWPARSPSRHATLYIEGSDRFVASAAASIATGWNEPVPGRIHPLKSSAFSRRTFFASYPAAKCAKCEVSWPLTGQKLGPKRAESLFPLPKQVSLPVVVTCNLTGIGQARTTL